jgi:putative transposase
MHRTLKAETTQPPAANHRAQQRKFNDFRQEFNEQRPHEALDMCTPAQLLPALQSDRCQTNCHRSNIQTDSRVRYVSANGGIRWKHKWVNVTSAIIGEYVGLEEVDDGLWDVYFGPLKLGRLIERHLMIEDHLGRSETAGVTHPPGLSVTYPPGRSKRAARRRRLQRLVSYHSSPK